MSAGALVERRCEDDICYIALNRPARCNSLVPELLDALIAALDDAAAQAPIAVVLSGNGAHFSTGGDVAAFAALPRGERGDYADALVGLLNQAILKILAAPALVITRAHGAVTGGSAGFVFAADMAAMAEDAFIAPYYTEVGFSPDGGWTALLPLRIGPARAATIQYTNARICAAEAKSNGLVTDTAPYDALDAAIDRLLGGLRQKQGPSLRATKQLLYPPHRLDEIAAALEAERRSFVKTICSDAAERGMAAFLASGR